jgi:hypothetical protein
MDFKLNGKLMYEAVNSGCKTMAELALYLKLKAKLSLVYNVG